jgi:hypothetical protein
MVAAKIRLILWVSLLTLTCEAKDLQMSNMKTYCVGRYLVDLPMDAEINGQSYRYELGQIGTDTSAQTAESFRQTMEAREVELKSGKQKDGYKLSNVRRLDNSTWIFELEQKLLLGPSTGFEAHVWDDGVTFSMEETGYEPLKFKEVLAELQTNVLYNLHARVPDDIPSQPGFCLKGGFIKNDGLHPHYESAGMSFKFAHWPGVLVTLQTMTVTKLGELKLLQRMDSGPVPEVFKDLVGGIRFIRRGERSINGRDGEEMLSTVPSGNGYHLHDFRWEAQGTNLNDPLKPIVIVDLESGMRRGDDGAPVRPRLTDEQAVALFDAVASSVRLRPVDGAKVSAETSTPIAPLGTLARTGTPCPQTGWWTCPEAVANEIEGGRRQRFEAGTMMPVAKVLPKRSFVERMSGRQRKHDVNTVWKLIAYDADADRTYQ